MEIFEKKNDEKKIENFAITQYFELILCFRLKIVFRVYNDRKALLIFFRFFSNEMCVLYVYFSDFFYNMIFFHADTEKRKSWK